MNTVNTPCNYSSHSPLLHLSSHQWPYHCPPTLHSQPTQISCSIRRRKSNTASLKPKPSSDQNLEMVIDVERIKFEASSALKSISSSINVRFNHFIVSGKDTFEDLQTLITVDDNRRVLISCRRSSLNFMGNLVLWGCLIVLGFRALVQLGLGIRDRLGFGYVVRRDRSLGGREVVVAKKKMRKESFRVLDNLLLPLQGMAKKGVDDSGSKKQIRKEEKLPEWWPVLLGRQTSGFEKEEGQRKANRLIRAIMDNRMSGQDIFKDEIIQLRRICRMSGARVYIDTPNARDSFYRASVDFILNTCSSTASDSILVQIDGEDPRQFIAGLADNIGLEKIRAARIVSAAVAARTRSRLLQAWALNIQGKHSQATVELSTICLIHRIFPPQESSPEMEMVAQGLEKLLKIEQREFLMCRLLGVCGEDIRTSAAEALGLVLSPKGISNQQ